MGFYSPHSLVQDARRHGVEVRTPDINKSAAEATLEWPDRATDRDKAAGTPATDEAPVGPHGGEPRGSDGLRGPNGLPGGEHDAVAAPGGTGRLSDHPRGQGEQGAGGEHDAAAAPRHTWGHGGPAVRLGIDSVRGIGDDLAEVIAAGRPYRDMEDLARRVEPTLPQLEALATAGVFASFGGADGEPLSRREALWAAGAVAEGGADKLAGIVTGVEAPHLPGMDPREEALADLWATGVSPDGHPTRFVRDDLDRRGVVPASGLLGVDDGTRILVAGVVTHRQRPATAGGTTFINLEDETGLINVIVSKGCWTRHRKVARSAAGSSSRAVWRRARAWSTSWPSASSRSR